MTGAWTGGGVGQLAVRISPNDPEREKQVITSAKGIVLQRELNQ